MGRIDDVVAEGVADRSHGAGEIESRLLERLAAISEAEPADLRRQAERLAAGQPTMANLQRIAAAMAELDGDAFRGWVRQRLDIVARLPSLLAEASWSIVSPAIRVVTLSRSSAVAACLDGAVGAGWSGEVVVLDGSPAGGGREMARRLARTGLVVRSQPDAAMLQWLAPETVVLVGADAVGPDRFVNCRGTRLLLESAAYRGSVRVVVADSGKRCDPSLVDAVVERSSTAREDGPERHWPLFEAIPLALTQWRIDEEGRHRQEAASPVVDSAPCDV